VTAAELVTRAPSGRVPWPLVLVEGEDKSGRQWSVAELSGSELVSETYWVGIGESSADQYGAIPGARHRIVDHDGTFVGVLAQVKAVAARARQVADSGGWPVVLAVTGMHSLWAGLKDWTSSRARSSRAGREALAADPHADVRAGSLWQDASHRHALVLNELLAFPGIVVVTARGTRHPDTGAWTSDAHWSLAPAATAWVRMTRDSAPEIVGGRSVRAGIADGGITGPAPADADGRLLEWLIFDALGFDPGGLVPHRDIRPLQPGELLPEERAPEPDGHRPPPAAGPPPSPTAITPDSLATEARSAATPEHLDRITRRASAARASRRFTETDVQTVAAAVQARRTQLTEETPS